MYEIEAKVPLTKADLKRLQKEIPKIAKLKGKSIKKDDYYGPTNTFLMRIREKGEWSIFNIKSKNVKGGIELNQEVEIPVKSKKTFASLLKKIGIEHSNQKTKKSTVYLYQDLQIEINHVVGLGDYLEIEAEAESKSDIPKAIQKLHAIFKQFDFSPRQFEKRYYLDMLTSIGQTL